MAIVHKVPVVFFVENNLVLHEHAKQKKTPSKRRAICYLIDLPLLEPSEPRVCEAGQ